MRPLHLLVLAFLASACGAEAASPVAQDVPAAGAPQTLTDASVSVAGAMAPPPASSAVCGSCAAGELCEAGLLCHQGTCLPRCDPALGVSTACHEAFGIALPTSQPLYTCVDDGVCVPVEPCP